MAIDSHMHINNDVCSNVRERIEEVNNDSSISKVINVGLNVPTSRDSYYISQHNPKFYTAIGIHPLYVEGEDIDDLYRMGSNRVVAIGEIGLDTTNNSYLEQRCYLVEQIMLANSLCLPVIIHSNNSNKQVIEIFEKYVKPQYGCVFHCFQPDLEDLAYLVSNGYYISFAGRITFKNAKKSIEVLESVPDDLFIVETDSPFIVPEPLKSNGIENNSSSNLHYIIEKIAEIKGTSPKHIENITDRNVKRLFKRINY